MKKKLGIVVLIVAAFIGGCGAANEKTQAESDKATYIESIDEFNSFDAITLVEKESGCKFLVLKPRGSYVLEPEKMYCPSDK